MQGSGGIPPLPGDALHLSMIESGSQPRYTALHLAPDGCFCRIKAPLAVLGVPPPFRRQSAPSNVSRVLAPPHLAPFFSRCFPPLAASRCHLHNTNASSGGPEVSPRALQLHSTRTPPQRGGIGAALQHAAEERRFSATNTPNPTSKSLVLNRPLCSTKLINVNLCL